MSRFFEKPKASFNLPAFVVSVAVVEDDAAGAADAVDNENEGGFALLGVKEKLANALVLAGGDPPPAAFVGDGAGIEAGLFLFLQPLMA